MATPAEDARLQALEAIKGQSATRVASHLETHFQDLIPIIGGNVTPPETREDYIAMANELIEHRRMTVKTGSGQKKVVHLDDIDAKLPEEARKKLGGESLGNLIPKMKSMHLVAGAIGDGVSEETGNLQGATWKNAIAGFMQTIQEGGFFAAIGALLNLIFGDGKSESAQMLKKNIASVTAKSMQESVVEKLVNLRGSQPETAALLGDDSVKAIAGSVHAAAMKKAGFEASAGASKSEEATPLVKRGVDENVRKLAGAGVYKRAKEEAETAIREEIEEKTGGIKGALARTGKLLADRLGASTVSGWLTIPDDQQIKTAATVIAEASRDATTGQGVFYKGKRRSELTPQEFAEGTSEAVKDALLKHKELIPAFGRDGIEEIANKTRKNVIKNYGELPIMPDGVSGGESVAMTESGQHAAQTGTGLKPQQQQSTRGS